MFLVDPLSGLTFEYCFGECCAPSKFMLLLVFAYDVLSGSKARDDSLALVGDASFIVVEIG